MRIITLLVAILAVTACGHAGPSSSGLTQRDFDDYRKQLDQWLQPEGDPSKSVTDQEILGHATQALSAERSFSRENLGRRNGIPVRVDYPCSDICPDHIVRIVYYAVPDHRCAAVGGSLRSYRVPNSIGTMEVPFCFPAIVIANWQAYVDSSNRFLRRSVTAPRR